MIEEKTIYRVVIKNKHGTTSSTFDTKEEAEKYEREQGISDIKSEYESLVNQIHETSGLLWLFPYRHTENEETLQKIENLCKEVRSLYENWKRIPVEL